jgi:hypothetical protein
MAPAAVSDGVDGDVSSLVAGLFAAPRRTHAVAFESDVMKLASVSERAKTFKAFLGTEGCVGWRRALRGAARP